MEPMTSPCSSEYSPEYDAGRKSSKPAMEKRRRARINASLLQLKSLLLQANKDEGYRNSNKMEKADILEMAVKHLRQLQRQQFAVAASMNPGVVNKYRLGYNECADEVTRYLGSVEGLSVETRARLLRHLTTCLGENTRTRLPRIQNMVRNANNGQPGVTNTSSGVPAIVNSNISRAPGGVVIQPNHQLDASNNTVFQAAKNTTSVFQTAKLVDSNGSEMTILIGVPNSVRQQVMTSQTQSASQDRVLRVVNGHQNAASVQQQVVDPAPEKSQTRVVSNIPNQAIVTSCPIMTSQSPVDGVEKTYQEVGVWQDDVWRPW